MTGKSATSEEYLAKQNILERAIKLQKRTQDTDTEITQFKGADMLGLKLDKQEELVLVGMVTYNPQQEMKTLLKEN